MTANIIGIVGIIIGFASLVIALCAARSSKESAKASRESARAARESARMALRPQLKLDWGNSYPEESEGISVTWYMIHNTGPQRLQEIRIGLSQLSTRHRIAVMGDDGGVPKFAWTEKDIELGPLAVSEVGRFVVRDATNDLRLRVLCTVGDFSWELSSRLPKRFEDSKTM